MTRQALVQIVEAFGRSETRTYYSPAQIRKTTSLVLSPFTLGQRPRSYVLLRGPQDVGKRVIALSVVHALCCEEEEENQWGMTVPPEEACGQCAACELLRKGQCPDLIEVEPSTCSPEVLQELAGQNPSTAADELPNRFVLIERIERLSVPAFHTLCELLWYPELTTRRTLFLLTVTAGSDLPWHPGILANHHQERDPRPQSLTCESDFPVDVWPDSVYPTGPNGCYRPAEIADAEGLLDEGVPLGWRYLPEQCGEPLKVLLRRYPFFLDAREAMSWIATREGRFEDAAYHLTQYIALSQAPSQLARLGQVLLKLERFDEAIVALEYALFLQQRPTELGVNQVSPAKADVVRQAALDLAVAKSGTNSVRPLDPRLERGAEDVGRANLAVRRTRRITELLSMPKT